MEPQVHHSQGSENVNKYFICGLLASLTLSAFTLAHADGERQMCDARRVQHLVGEMLTSAVYEEAFKTSRATSITFNSSAGFEDPDRNRLIISMSHVGTIARITCG
jgi:hypothetical protein